MNKKKILQKLIYGLKNVHFHDMITIINAFGFTLSRTKGSHHIFVHPEIPELINIQNVKGKVKPYQVSQFLKLVERYNLTMEN